MKFNRGVFLFLFSCLVLALITISSVFANPIVSQSMSLLAVSEGGVDNETRGAIASVNLQIREGTGQIYIDTYPFSKVDTQVSVRLANEVACHFLNFDCTQYDFIYSIHTGSSTIGGPSAGAAISALTVASLDGQSVSSNTTISGTINSGGVIGAVGGLKEKIDAAADAGITRVLIPLGERYILDKENKHSKLNSVENLTRQNSTYEEIMINTSENVDDKNVSEIELPLKTDLIAYALTRGVLVVETGTLEEVLSLLTNKQYTQPVVTVIPPPYYTAQMKQVCENLCGSAQSLLDDLSVNISHEGLIIRLDNETQFATNQSIILEKSNIDLVETLNSARQLLNTSKNAYAQESYYAAASYCYGAALNLRFISLLNLTANQTLEIAQRTVNGTQINLSKNRTLTDLQTYMLVDERLTEANDHINNGIKLIDKNLSIFAINELATAIERVSSAKLWSSFFSNQDDEITLDLVQVEESCKIKIQEATERQSLIGYYIEDLDVGAELLAKAKEQLNVNPILCLFGASKAKATYDVVLSSLGLTADVFNATFEKKSQIAARVISEQFDTGAFPIIGYSYYEYARSLADSDQSASLLYIQYALELSNLEAYLPQTISAQSDSRNQFVNNLKLDKMELFVLGIALGLLAGITIIKAEQYFRARKDKTQMSRKWR